MNSVCVEEPHRRMGQREQMHHTIAPVSCLTQKLPRFSATVQAATGRSFILSWTTNSIEVGVTHLHNSGNLLAGFDLVLRLCVADASHQGLNRLKPDAAAAAADNKTKIDTQNKSARGRG